MTLTEIYADTRGRGTCRDCGAPLEWAAEVLTGRRTPFDFPLVALRTRHDEAGRVVEGVDPADRHLASCPTSRRR